MDSFGTDLEQAQRTECEKEPCAAKPSPTTTSSTAVPNPQYSRVIGRVNLNQLGRNLLSHVWRSKSADDDEDSIIGPPDLVIRTLEECPKGYPRLAAFLDSDENFMLYRRFGYLQSRIILHKQDELRALEEKLDILDQQDHEDPDTRKYLESRDLDDKSQRPRKTLLENIEKNFKEYAELLHAAQSLVSLSKPTPRDYASVKNFFAKEAPLRSEDEIYIYRKEDMITLKPGRENAWLDGVIERVLQKISCAPIRETRAKTTGGTVYYTKSRIEMLVTFIITAIILILLVVPVYVLWHLSILSESIPNTPTTIIILLVFTLLFSAVLSFFTRARRHEIFGAAAAYCAVLVVFISNVGQGPYHMTQ